MSEPILSREEVLQLASDAFGIDYDRLDARFEKYAALIEAAVLEKVCGEPVGILSVHRFRKIDSMVNWDFEYGGSLPDGSHNLYALTRSKP